MDKFAQKKPTCIAYDEKLQFYSNLVIEVRKWFFSPRLVGRFRHIHCRLLHSTCFLAVSLFSFFSRNREISPSETFTNLEVAVSLIKLQSNSSRLI